MTTRQVQQATTDGHFPEFPPREDMNNPLYLYQPGYMTSLHQHFGGLDTTLVMCETPLGWRHGQREGFLVPDLMIAFDVDVADVIARRGYSIDVQGRPPDFVLEVASSSTGRQDEERKHAGYQDYGVREYWRFDPSGGQYHRQALAGDVMVGGVYRPIEISETAEGNFWGHSEVLGLAICWENGKLRWWDPATERYLETHAETVQARAAAESRVETERTARNAAETQADADREARLQAEARVRELEAELERRRQP